MEGTTRLAGSHSRPAPPPPSSTASGVKPFAPHAEQYSEIFQSFRSGKACSIPMLDLPPFHDSLSAFDLVGCSGFVYSEIFGGFSFSDFALPYDELFRPLDSQDSSDDWTKVGNKSLSDKPDPSACSGRNQHFMNGGFHQTTVNKFNVSYNKVNTGTTKDSNMIHVPELGAIPGNSYIYEGSTLQEDVDEVYSSGVVDDVIFHEDLSGITTATQSTTYVLSDGTDRKDGRPHQINLSPTAITVSDVSLTTEPSHVPQTSRSPPTGVDRKKSSVSSMPENEHPKSNVANSLFDIGSLHFLNLELNTGSSDIASAEAIKEAMDRATVKLKSSRGSVERKNDATKGTRPVTKHDMNGDVKMSMFYDESVVSHDELLPKHENKFDLFKIHGKGVQDVSEASHVLPDPFQVENATNGVCTKKETEGRKRSVSPTDGTCAVLIEALEQKEDQGKSAMRENQESHFWLKKLDEESRKKENVMCEEEECETKLIEAQKTKHCEKNMEEATLSDCYEKKLKQYVEMEKFDKLEATTENDRAEKTIDAAHGQLERSDNTDKIKDGVADEMKGPVNTSEPGIFQTMYEDSVTNEEKMMDKGDLDPQLRNNEQERELEKEQVNNLEEEREKRLRLHLKKVAEFREKEREKEMEKNCLEEEKQWERELEKDCLRKLDNEWEWEREKEKDRMGAELNPFAVNERTSSEAQEREDRVAVERGTAAARQRAVAEARERLEKACAEAREKSVSEKVSTEARLREERVAVARTTVEAREHATEKTIAERAAFEVWGRVERSASENFSSPLRDIGFRHSSSSSDLWNSDKPDEMERESANRCRARLERHCRTVERVAKALAEKNTRDLIAQTEQAEKNRLAESLDADIKRWSNGKEGNLRALLSTLQYILGPDSGWHPIPLTEVITSTAVKKAYRKATLCVHPDKLQQRGASIQQRYICEKVFDLLKDAWKKFDSVER